uniref:Pleckstrin and Sec7 domain containing 3 n=1 Tax=Pipistrellus kuhlii TaxID=59472 RepID=A0A7J7ZLN0_PIPKU|nr:pleckstrin and Sec7 domain containing 3 [Pipistrellus kuhlii]
MIGVNSVQSASKVRVRTSGSVKYSREDSIRRQSHRSKSMKISNSSDFSAKETKALYNSIKNEKLEWAVDDEEKKKSSSEGTEEKANGTHPKTISRVGSTTNPFLDIPHDPNAAVYKSGFLARKIHADMDGKKTPRGKRGWKTFYAVLKGTILYLQKEEEQLKSHESKLKQITTELAEHRSYPPDKKVKAKEIDEYKLKDHYLEFEQTRYETYIGILKEGGKKLLGSNGSEAPGLKKSHSSPSLNPDSSPVTAKVKRNVSERKDHRPETPSIKQKVT